MRESEILDHLSRGLSNRQIGLALGTSPNTVRNQIGALFRKLEVASRTELLMAAVAEGYLPIESTEREERATWRRFEEPRFSLEIPSGWSVRPSVVPAVAALFVEDATASDVAPTWLRVKIEPFDGDTRAYVDLGMTKLERTAHILRTSDVDLGGLPAVEVEADVHALVPRVRSASRAAVRDGIGYVVQCASAPERWSDAAPVFRAILATLRIVAQRVSRSS